MQLRQKKSKAPSTLLNWAAVHERMPWNIVLLLGGGYALASGSEVKKKKRKRENYRNWGVGGGGIIHFDDILKAEMIMQQIFPS